MIFVKARLGASTLHRDCRPPPPGKKGHGSGLGQVAPRFPCSPWWRVGRRLAQLVFILLAEAVPGREEIPAALLVHLPDVGFLRGGGERENAGWLD